MAGLVITGMSAVVWMTILVRLGPRRGQKGSNRRMMILFLLGMLSVVPTLILSAVVPTGNPDGELSVYSLALWVCIYAPIEEASKFLLFLILVTRLRSLREPADGVFQAAAVGLGFAIVENVLYAMRYGAELALLRATITPARHMVYAAVWGLVYAMQRFDRSREALATIESALVHDPANHHLHLRAAHFRLRCGDVRRATAHLERFLAAQPDDSYGTGLMGAALVLSGSRHSGTAALERAQASGAARF